jgi:D-isomer specific 2-hydroxyacid dehydrogenase, NAD binding domain
MTQPFGITGSYLDRKESPKMEELGFELVKELDEFLPKCDVVSIDFDFNLIQYTDQCDACTSMCVWCPPPNVMPVRQFCVWHPAAGTCTLPAAHELALRGMQVYQDQLCFVHVWQVSINVPLTKSTRGMIDSAAIKKMKKGAYLVRQTIPALPLSLRLDSAALWCLRPLLSVALNGDMSRESLPQINNARGAIVDQDAVVEALESGQLGGYSGDHHEHNHPTSQRTSLSDTSRILLASALSSLLSTCVWAM